MRRIRATPHRQQKHILPCCLLKGNRYRNTPTLPRHVRLDTKDLFHGLGCGTEVPVLGRADPVLATMLAEDVEGIFAAELGELVLNVFVDEFVDSIAVHVRYGTDGELADHFGWDDGFGAWGREGAFDAVDRKRGVAPARHQGAVFVWVDSGFCCQGIRIGCP